MLSRERTREVYELLERHWTLNDISHRLKLDIETLVNIVNNLT